MCVDDVDGGFVCVVAVVVVVDGFCVCVCVVAVDVDGIFGGLLGWVLFTPSRVWG